MSAPKLAVRKTVKPVRLVAARADSKDLGACELDVLEACTLADLELMYIDALWTYYHPDTKGQFNLSDEDFDRLKDELYWQGSGFPTLHREEIDFVEASIAYARGEPVVSDEEYENLKTKVRSRGEKRDDVTALLLYTKGQQLLEPEQYDRLAMEMQKLGIEVGLKGATCTLNETTDEVVNDSNSLLKMYAGMGAIPTVLSFTAFSILGAPWNNFHIGLTPTTFLYGLGVASVATYALMRYLDLHNTEILVGKCPCCETPIKQLFSGSEPADSFVQNCPVCGTSCSISRKDKRMSLASGPDFIKA